MKHSFTRILFLAFCIVHAFGLSAQQFGANPNFQNWKIIRSDKVNMIYPKDMERSALRTMQLIHELKDSLSFGLGKKTKKVNIILQNKLVESNGFVATSPFRSSFFSTAPQSINFLGTTDWMDILSIHEYRHVLQFSNSINGFTKLGLWLQGEEGWSALIRLALPNWYFEGDAVLAETKLSKLGRGRMPSFTAQQRAIANAEITYNYHKIRNGSFKDFIPNHYPWGFSMMAYFSNELGMKKMTSVLKNATAYRSVFYPFSRALKKESGLSTKQLYQESWSSSKKLWSVRLEDRTISKGVALTDTRPKTISFYHFPQFDSSGNVWVMKNSYKKTDQIQKINNEEVINILAPGPNLGSYFNYNNGRLVWTEKRLNARRNNQSFSDIYLMELKHAEKQRITKKGRYFSPIISLTGEKIIAVELSETQIPQLIQLDLNTNQKRVLLAFNAGELISRPSFTKDEKLVVFVKKSNHKVQLWKFDLVNQKLSALSPETHHVIDAPRVSGDYVYYSASFNQIDNIYRSPLDGSKSIEQITSVKIGAYEPDLSSDGKTLIYKEHILHGSQVSRLDEEDFVLKTITIKSPVEQEWQLKSQDQPASFLSSFEEKDSRFTPEPYRGLFRGFRLHSWPITASPSSQQIELNFDNYLNDISARTFFGYNNNEEKSFYGGSIRFGRWLPVIGLNFQQSNRSTTLITDSLFLSDQQFVENKVGLSLGIPLRWIKDNYFIRFQPTLAFDYHLISNRTTDKLSVKDENFSSGTTSIRISAVRRTALQNIAPRFGFSATVSYQRDLEAIFAANKNEKLQELFTLESRIYLPGIAENHSLQLSGGFQKEMLTNRYQFSDNFNYSRGFASPLNDNFTRLSVDYGLPLIYPDWGFWGISYFKRIRANVFYDYGRGEINLLKVTDFYQSTGLDLSLDNVYFNTFNLSITVRGSYLLTADPESPNTKFSPSVLISAGF